MSFFKLLITGTMIGIGVVIPGVSGAVLAIIFNVYDKIISSFNNIFSDFKKSFKFLMPIITGVVIGIVFFGKVMLYLFSKHQMITKYMFIGLILGGVPYLFKKIKKDKTGFINYFFVCFTFVLTIVLWLLNNKMGSESIVNKSSSLLPLMMLFSGFLYSVGKIVPGISGSFILIMLGIYEQVLKVVTNPFSISCKNIFLVIMFVLGFLIGCFVFVKILNYLLKKYYAVTYSAIIGFVLGSVVAINPPFTNSFLMIKSIIIMIISFTITYKMSLK